MKFLECSNLESLSSEIQQQAIDCCLDLKLEAYSCKMVQSDKKQWKKENATQRQALSPPEEELAASPVGRRLRHLSEPSQSEDGSELILLDSVAPRTLFDLVAILNSSYPDYDFSDRRSNNFSLISSFEAMMRKVDEKFSATVFEYNRIRNDFWAAIKSEIKPEECLIYTFMPDYTGDAFTEDGCVWSFNFFLHNKNLKRWLFLSCRALSTNHAVDNLDMSAEQLWDVDS